MVTQVILVALAAEYYLPTQNIRADIEQSCELAVPGALLLALEDIIEEDLAAWDELSEPRYSPKEHEVARDQGELQEHSLQIIEQQQLLLYLFFSLGLGDLGVASAHRHAKNIKIQINYR